MKKIKQIILLSVSIILLLMTISCNAEEKPDLLITHNNPMAVNIFNYETQKYEMVVIHEIDWSKATSQDTASQGMYRAYIGLGKTPIEAAMKVLETTIKIQGRINDENNIQRR